jgi:hypothetical protein
MWRFEEGEPHRLSFTLARSSCSAQDSGPRVQVVADEDVADHVARAEVVLTQ